MSMWRFCTECGKRFAAGNGICPYCSHQNRPLPNQLMPEQPVPKPQAAESKTACWAYIPPIQTPPKKVVDPHSMTIEEYEDYYNSVRIAQAAGRILSSLHQRTLDDRRHQEVLQAIREQKEQ